MEGCVSVQRKATNNMTVAALQQPGSHTRFCRGCRPVYVPSEAKVTYTAGRVLPADPASLALSNGALNKLLEGREGEGSPAFMSIEDAQEGFLMSECSMYIDAAYTEAQPAPKPARRWLQVSISLCHSAADISALAALPMTVLFAKLQHSSLCATLCQATSHDTLPARVSGGDSALS